ncbi:hypothetical protein L3Q82_013819 [Scortum barcoo]|uniref:Uncharacterized protein n=1 Tax=Scortum barcoo TaxID=214431 RepID=A0ACB8VW41_9TELE|nr:hypothetical protein L3Q82_013819 [Scortum barcoo]
MADGEAQTPSIAYKVFTFEDNRKNTKESLSVSIPEVLDPHYGMYVWPCAVVLAQYLWTRRRELRDKTLLELGAGVSLPGVVAARCGAKVILSDSAKTPQCLDNCRRSCEANGLQDVAVLGLTWGEVSPDLVLLPKLDVILGSDVFYDPQDHEVFTCKSHHQNTLKPDHNQSPKPDHNQTVKPKPDHNQTVKPKPDHNQTPKPDHNQTPKPDHNQTPKPDHNQTPKPDHNQTPKPDHNQTPKPDQPVRVLCDFEDVLVTVVFLLRKNPRAQFWTTVQERSADWSIEALLHRWKLNCIDVRLETFDADKPELAGSSLPGNHSVLMMIITLKTEDEKTLTGLQTTSDPETDSV